MRHKFKMGEYVVVKRSANSWWQGIGLITHVFNGSKYCYSLKMITGRAANPFIGNGAFDANELRRLTEKEKEELMIELL